MLLSRGCEYGLRAAIYIAQHQGDGYVPIRKVSDDLGIPFHFLTKILQQLNGALLVESFRGPTGGVRLAREPGSISLKDIVVALDGDDLFCACVLGLPGCGDEVPCPLHVEWSKERDRLSNLLESTTLAETASQIVAGGIRIGVASNS